MSTSPVLFSLRPLSNGKMLGHAQLNLPGSLNALNLEMVQLLTKQLTLWQQDDSVVGVLLSGAGDKAFCAGGDVVSLYNAMQLMPGKTPPDVEAFFTQEYQLDYLIHSYSKPVIVWGNGFIMGGGIGLFAGASHKVVTETSRLAMPEITIGLFPDVGGSYFLNKLTDNCGLFLGLTGAQFNGADAKLIGLADHAIAGISVEAFLSKMATINVSDSFEDSLTLFIKQLEAQNEHDLPVSNVLKHQDIIKEAVSNIDLDGIVTTISAFKDSDDKWLSRAAKALIKGSPITQRLVFEQIHRGKTLSLAQCFQMELIMACRCASAGEFAEGVRALLIEKDGAPQWLYSSHNDVPDAFVESFFKNHWDDTTHPLAQLGVK